MKISRKNKDLPKVEPVKIKSLFGLKPGLWLTILYSFVLVLFIFLVCFLPGIKNGGKRVTFTSNAYNCAVYLDENYIGGTPFTRFVPSGTHKIDYRINGVSLDSFEIKVSHPVFITWMFPRKMTIHSNAEINKAAYKELLKEFITDLGSYSAIMEYDDTFRYPSLYENFVKTVISSPFASEIENVLDNTATFVTTEEMLEDFKSACRAVGLNSDNFSFDLNRDSFSIRNKSDYSSDLSFEVTELNGIKGYSTGTYYVSELCITESQYAQFVKENSKWSKDNVEELIEEGLADEYYLSGVNLSTAVSTNKPVRNVSYKAAEAYCAWLSKKTGKIVKLPSEKQWIELCLSTPETGMQKALTPITIAGYPSAMLGCVWEMTETFYIPHVYNESDLSYKFAMDSGASLECIIKGGSYVSSTQVSAMDVGTAPLNLCSDYMGFRIIWY